jgi:hypothetical protein
MKKMVISLVAVSLLATAGPALALFTNGGFEAGDFSGWTLQYGDVETQPTAVTPSTALPVWGTDPPSGPVTPVIITAATPLPSGQTIDVDPYNGTYMAKINNLVGGWHATMLSQTAAIGAGDIGTTLYVNWGAMLTNPLDPPHPDTDQPFFSIKVKKNGSVIDAFSANGNAANLVNGWVVAGSGGADATLWYKTGQYSLNLSSFALGDNIGVEMFATDCGQGAHGGYAFLDGIGTEYVPPPVVPEPSSIILLAMGLVGVGIARKRTQK